MSVVGLWEEATQARENMKTLPPLFLFVFQHCERLSADPQIISMLMVSKGLYLLAHATALQSTGQDWRRLKKTKQVQLSQDPTLNNHDLDDSEPTQT